MDDYTSRILAGFRRGVEKDENPLSAGDIVKDLVDNCQWGAEDYISPPEELGYKVVRVPDRSSVHLPGRANAVEEFFRGHPEQLLTQRLLISEDKAKRVIAILKEQGFKISP